MDLDKATIQTPYYGGFKDFFMQMNQDFSNRPDLWYEINRNSANLNVGRVDFGEMRYYVVEPRVVFDYNDLFLLHPHIYNQWRTNLLAGNLELLIDAEPRTSFDDKTRLYQVK